jgi:hypothetical protein
LGLEIGPFLKVGLRLGLAAQHQVGQTAKIVGTRIVRSPVDGLCQFFVRGAVISGQVRMNPVAIILGEDRLIVDGQHCAG